MVVPGAAVVVGLGEHDRDEDDLDEHDDTRRGLRVDPGAAVVVGLGEHEQDDIHPCS